jgi:gliding motility-associated-like protein
VENNINIEELFKSGLQNMESNPPVGGWEAIQAKLAANAAAGATTAAVVTKTTLGLAKIAAIATIAVGTGLGVGYFVFKGTDKKGQNNVTPTTNTQISDNTNNNKVELPGNIQVTEINSVHQQGKVLSIMKVTKGNETQNVLVEVNQAEKDKSPSIVGQWLSTDKDKNKYSQDLINKLLSQFDSDDESSDESAVETSTNTNNDVKVQKLEENEVIAGIKANIWSGPAPLTVEFSNLTPAESYEWTFTDNGQPVKESSPRYTYTDPGNYLVTLTVKNKSGKTFKDKVLITVEDKKTEEASAQEESAISKIPNVFTPNGDGKNDVFRITGKNIEQFHITIVDQKGKTWFESNDINLGWDGMDAPEGNYVVVYTATGRDNAQYSKKYLLKLSK